MTDQQPGLPPCRAGTADPGPTMHDVGDRLTVLSLFAGIGGLDLGLEAAGCTTRWYSEVDPYACKIMERRFPDAVNLGDITEIDWTTTDARPDIICGGFPCQDISNAGKQAGIAEGTRSGLWACYADAVRHLRPRVVIVENVAALLARGMGRVLGDLAACGYDAWWDCVPAAAVGAPHLRDRVFIVGTRADVTPFKPRISPMQWAARAAADAERIGGERWGESGDAVGTQGARQGEGHQREWDGDAVVDLRAVGADADSERGHRSATEYGTTRWQESPGSYLRDQPTDHAADADHPGQREQWRAEPIRTQQPATQRGGWWSVEPSVGRVAHGIPAGLDDAPADQSCDSQAGAASSANDDGMRGVRSVGELAAASPRLQQAGASGDPVPEVSHSGGSRQGNVGSGKESDQDLRDMPLRIFGVQPQQGQDLLAVVPERTWPTQRSKTVGWWSVEPSTPRVAAGVESRVDRLRCLGNAVVPQVAEYIARIALERIGAA